MNWCLCAGVAAAVLRYVLCVSRQCVPCSLDDVLAPLTTPEAQNEEKALLEQLVSFLSGTDESELAKLDKALGIDKLVQVGGCWGGQKGVRSSHHLQPVFSVNIGKL